MHDFSLHPQLARDTHVMGDFPLCRLLLHKDANYPWFILVPRRADISEVYQLTSDEQQQLWLESRELSQFLMQHFDGDKLNLAALGNMVPQLHLHHIVRFKDDPAWPNPVWGYTSPTAYDTKTVARYRQALLDASLDALSLEK